LWQTDLINFSVPNNQITNLNLYR